MTEYKVQAKNLPEGTSEEQVREFFEKVGPVVYCAVRQLRDGSNIGFASFGSQAEADSAVSDLDGKPLNGGDVQVQHRNADLSCFKCGQSGHMSRECPQGDKRGRDGGGGGDRACFKCGEQGHMSRECPQGGGGSYGGRAG